MVHYLSYLTKWEKLIKITSTFKIFMKSMLKTEGRKTLTLEVDALTVLMTISFLPFCRGQQDKTKLASWNKDDSLIVSLSIIQCMYTALLVNQPCCLKILKCDPNHELTVYMWP